MTSQNMVVSSLNCWLDLAASRGLCASSAELAESCEDIPAQEDAMLQVSVPAGRIYPSVAWLSLAIEPGKGRCAEHPEGFCSLLFRVCRCVLEPPKFSRGIVAPGQLFLGLSSTWRCTPRPDMVLTVHPGRIIRIPNSGFWIYMKEPLLV